MTSRIPAARNQTDLTVKTPDPGWLGRALDATGEAFTLADAAGPDYPLVYVNAGFERLTGYSGAEALGKCCCFPQGLPLSGPELERIGQAVRERREIRLVLMTERKDGALFRREVSMAPVLDDDGAVRFVVGVHRDLSEHQQALDDIAAKRDRLLDYIELAPLGILALDSVMNGIAIADMRQPDAPLVYVNAAFERLTGYAAEEVLGRNWMFLHAADLEPSTLGELRTAVQERRETRLEARHVRKDGTPFWVELALIPVLDDNGTLTHYLAIQSDISERKQSQRQLEQMSAELRRNRDDLIVILNQFPCATMIIERDGAVSFASASCHRTLGIAPTAVAGKDWRTVLPLSPDVIAALQCNVSLSPETRSPVVFTWRDAHAELHWVECDIQDDPRDASRRILFLDDVTELHRLRNQLETEPQFGLIGESEPMRQLHRMIGSVALGSWTVLIEGETGSGKELVARGIHAISSRKDRPFIAVNSAGLSQALLSSQLFGHRKGAFTGAAADQQGFFEAAAGGTLFLDEIGDLPLPMQASLLRVVQEREITRLGETRPRRVDVRLIAATNKDLAAEVQEGRFREDLLFRLRVARLAIPPLRERKTDIPMLAEHFFRAVCQEAGKEISGFTPSAMRCLMSYRWPGNVRELKACVDYAVIYAHGRRIHPTDLPPELQTMDSAVRPHLQPRLNTASDDRTRILDALATTGGQRTAAARLLGMSRATFYRRLRALGLGAEP